MTGRRWLITALLATVTPPAAAAQQGDSLLVEVSLAGAGSTLLVVERDGAAGTVRVPTAPLYELAGLGEPPVAAATLDELRELLGIELLWLPRQLRIVMRDPWQLLPATRARVDRLRAEAAARAATTLEQRRHGAFGGVTVDDRREALLEFGYSMGRLYGRGAYSTVSGAAWSAGANPVSGLWLTYLQSERMGPRVGARVALRRSWVSAEYERDELTVAGAASLGPVVVFASSRDQVAVTWRGRVDVQVGHSQDRSAIRVSFGAVDPSPVSIPAVR